MVAQPLISTVLTLTPVIHEIKHDIKMSATISTVLKYCYIANIVDIDVVSNSLPIKTAAVQQLFFFLLFLKCCLAKSKSQRHSQERLHVQSSVANLLHHVIPAAWIWPWAACPSSSVPGGSSRTPPDPSRTPAVTTSAGARMKLAQALWSDWGIVGTRRGLVSEGLLETLLTDQGPRTSHRRGWNVFQGGGGRKRGVAKTEQTERSTEKKHSENMADTEATNLVWLNERHCVYSLPPWFHNTLPLVQGTSISRSRIYH